MDENHIAFQESLAAYALGALDADEVASLEAHLQTCESCREELAGYRALSDGLLAGLPPRQPSPALRRRLQGRLRMVLEAMRVLPAGEFLLGAGVGALLPLFIAGIPEEVVYRGILQTRLERLLGRLWAILITALLFTAWHLPTRFLLSRGVEGTAGNLGSVLLGTGVPVLIIGLLLGIVWDRYRNLPSLIAFHWGVDTLPTMLAMLGVDF